MSVGNFHSAWAETNISQYELSSSTNLVTEGNSFTITLRTKDVADGTTVGYSIAGVTTADLSSPGSLTGNFTVTSNIATLNVGTNVNDDVYLFVLGEQGVDNGVYRYVINPDLSGATFLNSLLDDGSSTLGMYFKPDGSLLFLQDTTSDQFRRYTFTAAPDPDQWNLVPLSATPTTGSYGTTGSNHQGMWISNDGTVLFQVDRDLKLILQDSIPAWNPLNPGTPSRTLDISANVSLPTGISVKPDGTKAFISAVGTNKGVHEYSGTAFQCNTWTISHTLTTTEFITDVYVTDAGTQMYICDDARKIHYYTLGTAWDLSTATRVNTLDLSASFSSVSAIYVAKPTIEVFKITLDATDSAGNRTNSQSKDVLISEPPADPGFQLFSTPGTTSFTVPAGVTSVNVVAIGGGGGGQVSRGGSTGSERPSSGGGGAGLGWKNNIPVIPGVTYTVVVGAGGTGGTIVGDQITTSVDGSSGANSYFITTDTVRGNGGGGGDFNGGFGGSFVGDGGGTGGEGQDRADGNIDGGGGGGAAGYSGNGGGTNFGTGLNPAANSGGGGGGAGREYDPGVSGGFNSIGGNGGGVGAHGIGADGSGGGLPQVSGLTTAPAGTAGSFGSARTYGGGGAGAMYPYFDGGSTRTAPSGGNGAVLIRWGDNTQFPDYKDPASY